MCVCDGAQLMREAGKLPPLTCITLSAFPTLSTLFTLFTLQGLPTVPSLLGEEKATNPFLRPFSEAIRRQMGQPAGAADWEVFGAVRKAKDSF